MHKKVIVITIVSIIVIIGVASAYSLLVLNNNGQTGDEYQPTLTVEDLIRIKNERPADTSSFGSNVIEAHTYDIEYSNNEIIEQYGETYVTCFAQKATFIDKNSAEEHFQTVYTSFGEVTSNQENLKIYQFEGYSFITLHIDSKREQGYGVLVRNENQLIYVSGNGFDKATIIKVCEWLIQN